MKSSKSGCKKMVVVFFCFWQEHHKQNSKGEALNKSKFRVFVVFLHPFREPRGVVITRVLHNEMRNNSI